MARASSLAPLPCSPAPSVRHSPSTHIPLAALGLLLGALLALGACSKPPPIAEPPPEPPAVKKGRYKVGDPYTVRGVLYHPHEDWDYEEVGVASWYGPNFHGKDTANGEVFDQNSISAAHRTLPMPSLVEVEHLGNKRRLVVRINDRGPFAHDRIIDLSRRAAQLLGFEQDGTAPVRVAILAEESRLMKAVALGERPESDLANLREVTYRPVQREELPFAGPLDAADAEEEEEGLAALPEAGADVVEEEIIEAPGGTEVLLEEPRPDFNPDYVKEETYYLQVGSFRERANAEALARELSEFGVAAIQEADVGGEVYHRVRLGPLDGLDASRALALRLTEAGHNNIVILRQEPTVLNLSP